MQLNIVKQLLEAEVLCCPGNLGDEIYSACGSDLMSDVLAFVKEQGILLTGLMNLQVVRTVEMMDMRCIVFVRGKRPVTSILELAEDRGITVMVTPLRMYEACGRLYQGGLCPTKEPQA